MEIEIKENHEKVHQEIMKKVQEKKEEVKSYLILDETGENFFVIKIEIGVEIFIHVFIIYVVVGKVKEVVYGLRRDLIILSNVHLINHHYIDNVYYVAEKKV